MTKSELWSDAPLPAYTAQSQCENGISYMIDRYGNRLPSYTSIVRATQSAADKARLFQWRRRVGQAEASRICATSRQRGILGHRQLMHYWHGETTVCPSLITEHWHHLSPYLEQIQHVRLVEGNLFHFYEGYAGRVDCVASWDSIPCVIDFKFCDRLKPIYNDQCLQLAAYCGAVNRQYGLKHKLKINHALLVRSTPDEVDITLFEPQEMLQFWHQWQARVAQFWQIQNHSISA
ncbi:exonuclease [Roseofilum sp. BLCC_M154]|uniref:Exonuclease n=1 Tax=Roseofilum acuticapitatum BLCC-M154 TaxID=3022444 RepID=A0ABT7AQN2_9CYAN|nr:hypothetical protein [Roseofilum acuticapitatum]MDJ1169213.1 exonuclease [Roseofilum acuticapitatum BLCC-M154]